MARRTLNKALSERWHFKRRLRERYGIRANRFTYREMVDLVKSRTSKCVAVQSNTRTVHRISYQLNERHDPRNLMVPHDNGLVSILVIYDKLRGELITALPPDLTDSEIYNYTND